MFERLWMALGIKKRPLAGARPEARNVTVQRSSASKQPPVMARRLTSDDDGGFPATQISSFPDSLDSSERRKPTRSYDDERDVPMPFRSQGGGDFGGGGASRSWDCPTGSVRECDATESLAISRSSSSITGASGGCETGDVGNSGTEPTSSGGDSND